MGGISTNWRLKTKVAVPLCKDFHTSRSISGAASTFHILRMSALGNEEPERRKRVIYVLDINIFTFAPHILA